MLHVDHDRVERNLDFGVKNVFQLYLSSLNNYMLCL